MPARPTSENVRQAREQAEAGANVTLDAVKGPLLAALGAVAAATNTVTEAFSKVRSGATERTEETQNRLQSALNELQARVSELPKEVAELRHRMEPAELRKMAEEYRDATQKAYASLVERGEEVFGELRSRPGVKQAIQSVESGVDTAQERLEIAVRDLNSTVDELRSRFARTSRSIGEKAALKTQRAATAVGEQVQDTADKVSEVVNETGDEAAATTRSTARKAAARAEPPRKQATRGPGDDSTRQS